MGGSAGTTPRIDVVGALLLAPLGAYIQYIEEPLGASRSLTMAALVDATLLITTTGRRARDPRR